MLTKTTEADKMSNEDSSTERESNFAVLREREISNSDLELENIKSLPKYRTLSRTMK